MRPLICFGLVLACQTSLEEPQAGGAPPKDPAPSIQAPWTSFRGDERNTGRRTGSVPDVPRLRWSFDAKGEILSTAAIAGGRVYVGTSEAGLLCLDLNTADKAGKELWRHKIEAGIETSPTVHGGLVLFGDDSGVFRALDAGTGEPRWTFKTFEGDAGGQEIKSSAVVIGDRVLFGAYDQNLYCLSVKDGKKLWAFETQGPIHATPAVVEGKTFVAGCDEHLRTIDIAEGKETAALATEGYSAGAPAVWGSRLVIGTSGSKVLCVDWKETKVLWTYENPDRQFPYQSGPAIGILEGGEAVALIGGRDKLLHAIRLADGKRLWTFPTRAKVDSSPVVVGSRVIAAGLDGNVYVLELATGKEVWKFAGGGGFAASPAVGEGRLVISNDEGLVYCFDLERAP